MLRSRGVDTAIVIGGYHARGIVLLRRRVLRLYEMTPDAMPGIGPAPEVEGFQIVAGFSGHGFQHSPAAGRLLADLIAGRDPGFDLAPFSLARFGSGAPAGEAHSRMSPVFGSRRPR